MTNVANIEQRLYTVVEIFLQNVFKMVVIEKGRKKVIQWSAAY